jgi:hypothetical protein
MTLTVMHLGSPGIFHVIHHLQPNKKTSSVVGEVPSSDLYETAIHMTMCQSLKLKEAASAVFLLCINLSVITALITTCSVSYVAKM